MSNMTKKTTSFNIDGAVSRIAKPSVFDRIVKEINTKNIPAKYIEKILVQYHDGNIVELQGAEITCPIPMNKDASWDAMEGLFKKMRDVRIFILTEQLEIDINVMVEDYLGKHC